MEDEWCLVPLRRRKTCCSWCSAWLFGLFFVSPLKEQRGKRSSPQRRRLSKATTPQSCSTQVSLCLCLALGASVPDPTGGVAGWWGGLCHGLPHLISRPKSPKPLAGFGSHAGKPSSSHSPGTTAVLLYGAVAETSLPHALSHEEMGAPGRAPAKGSSAPAQNPFPLSLPGVGGWLRLVPGARLLLPGSCRLHWWCWPGRRQTAAG